MKLTQILAVSLCAFLIASCCPCQQYQKKYGQPLVGTQWSMTQFNGRPFENAGNYTITLDTANRVSGIGDCNRIMGSYDSNDAGKIEFKGMASTRMFCPNQSTEGEFLQMLENADSYQLDGPMLMLFQKSEMKAVFEAPAEATIRKTEKVAKRAAKKNK